jgi:hypothetical protein
MKLYPLWATPFNNAGTLLPTLRISMVVAAFVLLIACANVGNLLLVRSSSRLHEMSVRLSVGARFSRLLRQLVAEQLVLSSLAVAGGFAFAYWCRNLIVLLRPTAPGITVNLPAEIDWRVMAISAAVCVISAFLFGLIPALQARKVDLIAGLRNEAAGVVGGRGRKSVRSGLILAQVALSFVLLSGTALLVRSVEQIRNTSPGFATRNLLTSSIDFLNAGYDAWTSKTNWRDASAMRVASSRWSLRASGPSPMPAIPVRRSPWKATKPRPTNSRLRITTRSAPATSPRWAFR